ncbi:hypothetical protein ABZ741_34060 [Streptomyces globisporus]|uniref:hypothetical protein n=1 Tax=Streptomyces globisporus TaxID=1908 RepID=UPI00345F3948
MPILAGQIITAGQLNRLQPVVYSATGSSNLVLTTTDTDVPGASVTLTTGTANAIYVAHGVFCFDAGGAVTDFGSGILNVDGAQASGNARWSGEVGTDFGTDTQLWTGTLPAAGSHTLKLQGSRSAAPAGGIQITMLGAFTKILVTIYEVV